jgi:hypothetical protein
MRSSVWSLAPVLTVVLTLLLACGEGHEQVEPPPDPSPVVPTVLDPPGPKDPDRALRTAVFLGSCRYIRPTFTLQGYLYEMYYVDYPSEKFYSALERTTGCFADKTNGCKAAEECIGLTQKLRGPCDTLCLPGEVDVTCGSLVEFHHQCPKLGLQCTSSGCDSPREPCDPSTVDPCQENTPHFCSDEMPYLTIGPSCSDYGLRCGPSAVEELPQCQGKGAPCEPFNGSAHTVEFFFGVTSCEGTTMHRCTNGFEHAMDCGILGQGFTCQSAEMQFGFQDFCGLGSECDVLQTPRCEGDTIAVCNAGRIDRIDCKALGFLGCDPLYGVCFPSSAGLLW